MLRQSLVGFILKIALGISLLYGALFSFYNPIEAVKFYPSFLAHSIDDRGMVYFFGIVSILLIIWIFSGQKKFISSLVSTVLIGLIALVNIMSISFLFKIAPTFLISLALVFRYYPRVRVIAHIPAPGTVKKVIIHEEPADIADDEKNIEEEGQKDSTEQESLIEEENLEHY